MNVNKAASFDESQHPRDADGKFGQGGGDKPPPLPAGHGLRDATADANLLSPRKPRQPKDKAPSSTRGLRDATADAKLIRPKATKTPEERAAARASLAELQARNVEARAKLDQMKAHNEALKQIMEESKAAHAAHMARIMQQKDELNQAHARVARAHAGLKEADGHAQRKDKIVGQMERSAKWESAEPAAFEAELKRRMAKVTKAEGAPSPASTYHQEFRDKARAQLPAQTYDRIHVQARGAAGGRARRPKVKPAPVLQVVRFDGAAHDEESAKQWAEVNHLPEGEWAHERQGRYVEKILGPFTGPSTEVSLAPGVTAVYGAPKGKMARRGSLVQQVSKMFRRMLRGAATEEERVAKDDSTDNPPAARAPMGDAVDLALLEACDPEMGQLLSAHRLVAGMDYLLQDASDMSVADARQAASQQLEQFPTTYDAVMAGSGLDTGHLQGLDLDLACGDQRAAGALGVDTYPHDYGVMIHDVALGLPFPDGSARAIWFAAPTDWDPSDTPALLDETRRVLAPGGRLHLSAVAPPAESWLGFSRVPDDGGAGWVQYLRVAIPIPSIPGGDPSCVFDDPTMPVEIQVALAEQRTAPAELAMANLIHKRGGEVHQAGGEVAPAPLPVMRAMAAVSPESRVIPIAKADKAKQLVYGVVLAPNEIDTQQDYMEASEIEAAAHRYLLTSRVVGSEHGKAIPATPVESFIAPVDMDMDGPLGLQKVTKGSWVLGVKIHDPKLWEKVMQGEYTGFSVGGFGLRAPG